jgi:hypothetical protein
MQKTVARASAVLVAFCVLSALPAYARVIPSAPAYAPRVSAVQTPSATVNALARWAQSTGDSQDLPYVIVDKRAAIVFIYGADGGMIGSTQALLGLAIGDDSAPGVGDRELSDIAPQERTTPAGRFQAAYGPGPSKERVFWVDYGTAISLHPVITSNPNEHRLQRLRSGSVADKRITFGCINVPAKFYEQVVRPTFGDSPGIVYVLPEVESLAQVFPLFQLQLGPTDM